MTIEQLQQQVEELLGNAQILDAIDAIIAFAKQHRLGAARQDAVLLRNQFFSLKQKYEILGMLHHQEYQVQASRIAAGVLTLSQEGLLRNQRRNRSLLWVLPLALLLVGALAYWLFQPKETPAQQIPGTLTQAPRVDTPVFKPTPPVEKKDSSATPPNVNGTGTRQHSPERKPPVQTPAKVEIAIGIDDCWTGAEVLVDNRVAGTIHTRSKTIKVDQRTRDYTVQLRFRGKVSDPKTFTPDEDGSLNFLCNE